MRDFHITVTRFAPAGPSDQQRGLLGYATVVVHGLIEIDRIALRRTRGGVVTTFYPEHTDACGIRRRVVWPSADVRAAIDAALMQGLNPGRIGAS